MFKKILLSKLNDAENDLKYHIVKNLVMELKNVCNVVINNLHPMMLFFFINIEN